MPYIGNSPANVGNFQVVDDISSTFNGVLTSFALTALTLPINPAKSGQLLVSINGVLQEPDDTGTEGFLVSGSNIVFSSAPATGSTFWAVWQGQAVDIGTPSDGTVGTDQLSATGTKSGTTYLAGDNTWKTVVTDLVNDTTPQLGGDLDFQTHKATSFTSTGIDDNATSTAITIDASENVGIGTSSPSANLHVRNTSGNAALKLEYGAGGTISQIIGASSEMSLQAAGASSITTYTNGVERMRIDSAGNVGVRTSAPSDFLTVSDGAKFDQAYHIAAPATATNFCATFGKSSVGSVLCAGGINLNGDTAAANTLDDYEEGTWTPSINGYTTGLSGKYTKVGNMVTLKMYKWGDIVAGSIVGGAQVTGLPFTSEGRTTHMIPHIRGASGTRPFGLIGNYKMALCTNFGSTNYYTEDHADWNGFSQNGSTSVIIQWTFTFIV